MSEITGSELHYDFTVDVSKIVDATKDAEGRIEGFSQVIEKAGGAIDKTFAKSGQSVSDYTGVVKENVSIQKEIIKDLEKSIKEIEDRAGNMGPGIAQATVLAEAKELQRELDGEKRALNELEVAMKSTTSTSTTLSTRFLAAKNTLAELTLANKQGTPEFTKAEAEVRKYGLALNEANKNAKNLASGGAFAGMIQGVSLLSGGLAAAQSVMGLLGGENENLNRIMLKTQALMSVSITLQQLQTNVTTGGILSTTSLTTAKNFLAAANLRLATALGISTAAATVLMATLTLGLSVAIAGVIYLMSTYGKEAEKTSAMNKKVAESVAEPLVAYKQLQAQWNSLGNDLKAKEKFVTDNKDAFDKLGVSVTSVSDAENVLKNNSGAFIQAMQLRAKSAVLAQQAIENMKNSLNLEKEYKRKNIDKDLTVGEIAMRTLTGGVGGITAKSALKAEAEEVRKSKQANFDLAKEQLVIEKELAELNKKSNFKSPAKNDKVKTAKTVKSKTATKNTKEEEILLEGSLADLRKKLSEIEEAFSKTNDEITMNTLNQEKLVIDAQIKAIVDRYAIKEDEAAKEKAELEKKLQEFLVSQRNYEEKVTAIKEQYAKLRSVATTDDERNKIDAGMQSDLQKLASDELKKSKAWIDAFGEIEIYTAQKLAEVRAALLAELQRMEADGSATPEAVKAVQDQLKKIDVQANKSKGSFAIIAEGIKILGKEGKFTKEDLEKLKIAVAEVQDSIGFLGNIVADVSGIFSDMGVDLDSIFGDILKSISSTIDGLKQVGEGVQGVLTGLTSDNPIQVAAGVIKAIGGAIKAVAGWFNDDDKKEREIKRQAVALKQLEEVYSDLGRAIDKALGDKFFDASKQAIANLKQQKVILQQMIQTESSKKEADQGKIDSYRSQITSINRSIEDSMQSMIDKILNNENTKTIADKLADALTNAFKTGEDAATAMGKTVDQILQGMVMNALKMKILEPVMKSVVDKITASMGYNSADNSATITTLKNQITALEQQAAGMTGIFQIADKFKLQAKIDGLRKQLESLINGQSVDGSFDGLTQAERDEIKALMLGATNDYTAALEQYADLFGGLDAQSSSLSGAIKGITEQTAGVLAGQLNAMRINQGESLKNQVTGHSIARDSLLSLVKIEQNTANVHNEIYDLNKRLKSKGF